MVAEGVETKQALDDLRALGCDLVQGYYFTEPLEPDELSAWFGRGTPAPTAVRAALAPRPYG